MNTSLRKAAEMALEVFEHLSKGKSPAITKGELVYEIAALRQALEEPEPYKGISEYTYQTTNGRLRIDPVTGDVGIGSVTKELEQPEQEPVAWMDKKSGVVGRLHQWENATPLYAAPPKKEWVGLADEELQDLCDQYHDDKIVTVENLLLATEALLRGKNT